MESNNTEPVGCTSTFTKHDSNLCESLCSMRGFCSWSGVISPSSAISWQPLQTPSESVSSRA